MHYLLFNFPSRADAELVMTDYEFEKKKKLDFWNKENFGRISGSFFAENENETEF